MKPRVAIVGTGVAGLGCAYQLRDAASLTLIEREAHAGGHSNTVEVSEGDRTVPIDTGFIVFNKVTYPHLLALFGELDVPIQPSEMSFSAQHLPDGLEYNGMSFRQVFAQKRNLLRPRYWRFLGDVMRFFKVASASLDDPSLEPLTVRQFADRFGLSRDFLEYYLIPMGSAVWSTHPREMLDFPARTLLRFFHNHGFLGVETHHPWWTVSGGSRSYVRKLLERLGTTPRLRRAATAIHDRGREVEIAFEDGPPETFDRVVIATHGDEALRLLASPTPLQQRLLRNFSYQRNRATLHTDTRLMPKRRIAWASWNYRVEGTPDGELKPTTHYWMNALQQVSDRRDYFVSINAEEQIDPATILYATDYDHPVFDLAAIRAQEELPKLNAVRPDQRLYFCGSYFRYGFHEDAYTAGLQAAGQLRRHLEATGKPVGGPSAGEPPSPAAA